MWPPVGPVWDRHLRNGMTASIPTVGAGVLTRPPGFREDLRKAVGAILAVTRDGYGIGAHPLL